MLTSSPEGRPQQARAVATRARLVDAAAALLIEQGLRGTTTAAVAARAEVSQGALFKHFPTKVDLLAASVERALASLFEAFRAELTAALTAEPPTDLGARLRVGVAALWRVFRLPAMQSLFEVYLSARTEPELGRALEPLLAAHRESIHAEARAILPELADHPGLANGVDAVVWAMQGVALGVFSSDEQHERELLAFFERLAVNELHAAGIRREQSAFSTVPPDAAAHTARLQGVPDRASVLRAGIPDPTRAAAEAVGTAEATQGTGAAPRRRRR